MIKNNGCCDLEYAKKIKELGVKQEGLFKWHSKLDGKGNRVYTEIVYLPIKQMEQDYSAFTCGELGEMLPYYLVGKGELTIKKNYLRDKRTGWNVRYEKTINCKGEPLPTICGDIMANAMALMLIWLIENKMMEVGGDKN